MKTTFEMDGLFTQVDIDNRYIVMAQCIVCLEYSKWDTEHDGFICSFCGGTKQTLNSDVSLRTYNPLVHNKKKKRK